jgi:hypothetical protein
MPDNFQKWESEVEDHSFFPEPLKEVLDFIVNVPEERSLGLRPDLEVRALRIHLHSIGFILSR